MTEPEKRKRGRPRKHPLPNSSSTPAGVFQNLYYTEIVVLLDRSGSMESIKQDMVGGFGTFVAEQQAIPGRCDMTLVQFDSQSIDTVLEAMPLAQVPELVLEPRGGTPLLDAMGATITRVTERHATSAQKPDKVVFMVITDGQENSSKSYTRDQVKALVEAQTAAGWVFSYLGANVDSFAEAQSLGVAAAAAMNYTPNAAGVMGIYSSLGSSISSFRTGGGFTPLTPSADTDIVDNTTTTNTPANPNYKVTPK